jgi:hypothetical protein
MIYTIRLCGGPGEGQVIRLRCQTVDAYWWAAVRLSEVDENALLDLSRVYDEIIYHDTGICADGMHLYATVELLEQLQQTMLHRTSPPRVESGLEEVEEVTTEGMLPWSCWEPVVVAGMSGRREYPWDAIKREDTERLIREINEVISDESK